METSLINMEICQRILVLGMAMQHLNWQITQGMEELPLILLTELRMKENNALSLEEMEKTITSGPELENLIKAMEEKKYITKTGNNVSLAPAGIEFLDEMQKRHLQMTEDVLKDVTDQEKKQMIDLLGRIHQNYVGMVSK